MMKKMGTTVSDTRRRPDRLNSPISHLTFDYIDSSGDLGPLPSAPTKPDYGMVMVYICAGMNLATYEAQLFHWFYCSSPSYSKSDNGNTKGPSIFSGCNMVISSRKAKSRRTMFGEFECFNLEWPRWYLRPLVDYIRILSPWLAHNMKCFCHGRLMELLEISSSRYLV